MTQTQTLNLQLESLANMLNVSTGDFELTIDPEGEDQEGKMSEISAYFTKWVKIL
jgi:hypothetical protein